MLKSKFKRFEEFIQSKKLYELCFISILCLLGMATFMILAKSYGFHQRSIFFSHINDTFMDFINQLYYVAYKNPYDPNSVHRTETIYLPLAYLIVYPFSKLIDPTTLHHIEARNSPLVLMSVVIFLVLTSITLAIILYEFKNGNKIIRFFTVMALFISGISLFSLERANLIYVSVITLGIFILFYDSKNKLLRILAVLALAISSVLKIYPILFSALLLYRKKYKEIIWLLFFGLMLTFLPFIYFKGGLNSIPVLLENLKGNSELYFFYSINHRFGFSIVGILLGFSQQAIKGLFYFSYILLFLSILTSWNLKKQWQQVMLLSAALILTPAYSAFYTGLYLFIPIIMFLNEEVHKPVDFFYLGLIVIFLNPLQLSNSLDISAIISNLSLIVIYLILLSDSIYHFIRWIVAKKNRQIYQ